MSDVETSDAKTTLTAREVQYIAIGIECSKTPVKFDIDFTKVAEKIGIKSSAAAGNGFRNAIRKLIPDYGVKAPKANGETNGTANGTPASTPAKTPQSSPKKATGSRKGKKKVEADADAESEHENANDESNGTTSPKKTNGKKRARGGNKKDTPEDDLKQEEEDTDADALEQKRLKVEEDTSEEA